MEQGDFATWRRVMSSNLDGLFLSLSASLRMAKDGAGVVALSFAASAKPVAGAGAYGVAKAGVNHLVRIAALEAGSRKIRVNALAPGGVVTPIWDDQPFFQDIVAQTGGPDQAFAAMGAASPLGRFAAADETAAQIAFLLSDAAATITGAVLSADGGWTLT